MLAFEASHAWHWRWRMAQSEPDLVGLVIRTERTSNHFEVPSSRVIATTGDRADLHLFVAASVTEALSDFGADDVSVIFVEEPSQRVPDLTSTVEAVSQEFPSSSVIVVGESPKLSSYVASHAAGADLYIGTQNVREAIAQSSSYILDLKTGSRINPLFSDMTQVVRLFVQEAYAPSPGALFGPDQEAAVVRDAFDDLRNNYATWSSGTSVVRSLNDAVTGALRSHGFYGESTSEAPLMLAQRMRDRFYGGIPGDFVPEFAVSSEPQVDFQLGVQRIAPNLESSSEPEDFVPEFAVSSEPQVDLQLGVQSTAPDLAFPPEPGSLFWNTRFPGNESVLSPPQGEPYTAIANFEYRLETAIEEKPSSGLSESIDEPKELVGSTIQFLFRGTNVQFSTINGLPDFVSTIESDILSCDATGTTPFMIRCKFPSPGSATVNIRLVVENSRLLDQELPLRILGANNDEPPTTNEPAGHQVAFVDGDSPAPPSSTDLTGIRRPRPVALRIGIREEGGHLLVEANATGDEDGFDQAFTRVVGTEDQIDVVVEDTRRELVREATQYPEPAVGMDGRSQWDLGDRGAEIITKFAQVGGATPPLPLWVSRGG